MSTVDPNEEDDEDAKATKSDDAEVKIEKWDARLAKRLEVPNTPDVARAAVVLRNFCLKWQKRRLTQAYLCWLHQTKEF